MENKTETNEVERLSERFYTSVRYSECKSRIILTSSEIFHRSIIKISDDTVDTILELLKSSEEDISARDKF
jgi:hypothetical protein